MKISIIIPALNEGVILGNTMQSLTEQSVEIIVVDGGSMDDTVQVARQYTPNVLVSRKGRGLQQHTGAGQSHGDVLVFLHADTLLPTGYKHLIGQALSRPDIVFGSFRLRIHPRKPALNLIALMANLRARLLNVPYGDQAIFVRRSAYFEVGGFKDWPIMEDVDLVRRLNRTGGFAMANGFVQTSARRWQKENLVHTTLRNWARIIRYRLGASPYTLAGDYPDIR